MRPMRSSVPRLLVFAVSSLFVLVRFRAGHFGDTVSGYERADLPEDHSRRYGRILRVG